MRSAFRMVQSKGVEAGVGATRATLAPLRARGEDHGTTRPRHDDVDDNADRLLRALQGEADASAAAAEFRPAVTAEVMDAVTGEDRPPSTPRPFVMSGDALASPTSTVLPRVPRS